MFKRWIVGMAVEIIISGYKNGIRELLIDAISDEDATWDEALISLLDRAFLYDNKK